MPDYPPRGRGRGKNFGDQREPPHPESEQFRKLFIGGLSYDTSEDSLKSHFEKWGEIVDCVVMRDPNTKRSRGFGFITYKESREVDKAQEQRPHKIDGREVESKRAMPREEGQTASQQSVKKMFIGGIKDDTTEENIREVFEPFGQIESVDMITDKATGKARGFCFVTFEDYDSVDKCVLAKRHDVNGRQVEVKKAVSRHDIGAGGRGGGAGGGRGMGRGGRGGGRDWGGNQGGGYGSYGGGGYNQGGYSGGYGNQGGGGYGSGGYGNQGGGGGGGWNQGSQGGGYDTGYGGGYGNQGGGSWGGNQSFGSNYGDSYGGGAMKGNNYTPQRQNPYGGGYGSGGGNFGGGGGGGGGYGGYNRR